MADLLFTDDKVLMKLLLLDWDKYLFVILFLCFHDGCYWQTVELIVDDGVGTNNRLSGTPVGPNQYLNVNGPLQMGGTRMDMVKVAYTRGWNHKPMKRGFSGCIQNFMVNGKSYNLTSPSMFEKVDFGCSRTSVVGSIQMKVDWSFWIAILICLSVLTSKCYLKAYQYWSLSFIFEWGVGSLHLFIYLYVYTRGIQKVTGKSQ